MLVYLAIVGAVPAVQSIFKSSSCEVRCSVGPLAPKIYASLVQTADTIIYNSDGGREEPQSFCIKRRRGKTLLDEVRSTIGPRSHLTDSCTSFSTSHRQTVMTEKYNKVKTAK